MVVILTADEILRIGLLLVVFDVERTPKKSRKTKRRGLQNQIKRECGAREEPNTMPMTSEEEAAAVVATCERRDKKDNRRGIIIISDHRRRGRNYSQVQRKRESVLSRPRPRLLSVLDLETG
jgi:hypothetical protein